MATEGTACERSGYIVSTAKRWMNACLLDLPSLCCIQWERDRSGYIVSTARRRMNAGPLVLASVVFSQKPQPIGWAASLQVKSLTTLTDMSKDVSPR